MTPHYSDPLVTLYLGDCLDVMRELPDASVDSVVTDPPYGLEFMGKDWDNIGAASRNPSMKANKAITAGEPEKGNPWASERSSYGTPKRNPRCRKCGFQKFNHPKSKCQCDTPDWDLEGWHYNYRMQEWHEQWATEAFRVLKPGGYLLAFGGTRTYHRLASAIEDAGFEIRDTLMWIYASGFPKSLDVSKALDKVAGAERGDPTLETYPGRETRSGVNGAVPGPTYELGIEQAHLQRRVTAPATDLARKWEGWGTALKPAHEPIVMARKPLVGTVAANVTRYGTGALNIDGSRIGTDDDRSRPPRTPNAIYGGGNGTNLTASESNRAGRWPSNVLLSDPELFDEPNPWVVGSGATTQGSQPIERSEGFERFRGNQYNNGDHYAAKAHTSTGYPDGGGYSRFFIVPKADRAERERGLREFEKQASGLHDDDNYRQPGERKANHTAPLPRANVHPTVKPIDLMRHLVRLVTPPGGVTLDPFLGSGTTALAASEEGFRCIGIEREAEYLEIAVGRLMATPMGLGLETEVVAKPRKVSVNKTTERPPSRNKGWSGGWSWDDKPDDEEPAA